MGKGNGRHLLWALLLLPNVGAWLLAPHSLINAGSAGAVSLDRRRSSLSSRSVLSYARMGADISRGTYSYGNRNCVFKKKSASAGRLSASCPHHTVHPYACSANTLGGRLFFATCGEDTSGAWQSIQSVRVPHSSSVRLIRATTYMHAQRKRASVAAGPPCGHWCQHEPRGFSSATAFRNQPACRPRHS